MTVLKKWPARLATLLLLCFITSCGSERGLQPDKAELVAWYIEDIVRGAQRHPTELIIPNPSPAMERVSTWLSGGPLKGKRIQPRQIDERMRRWLALRTFFLQKQVVVLSDGLIAPAPTLSREDKTYVLPVVDAENHDRRSIDALIISMSDSDRGAAQYWVSQSAAARLALDKEAGATHWLQPATNPNNSRNRVVQ